MRHRQMLESVYSRGTNRALRVFKKLRAHVSCSDRTAKNPKIQNVRTRSINIGDTRTRRNLCTLQSLVRIKLKSTIRCRGEQTVDILRSVVGAVTAAAAVAI